MSAANIVIKISGQVDSSLSAAVKSAQSMLDGINGNKSSSLGGAAITTAANTAAAVTKASLASLGMITSGAVAASAASIKVGQDFEDAMSSLASTAGITRTSDEYAKLEEAARRVGSETNKSASEAADALTYMSLAGWSTTDSIMALDDLVKLSSASNTDLATTSDLVTDSMSALGLGMEDYSGYMDMVARANSAANNTSSEFMESMIGAGGAARVLGVSTVELGAAVGTLANNGTKGSEAGTALNSMFARFAGNDTAIKTLNDMGVSLYDAQGQFRGLETVLSDVNTGLDSMSKEDRNAAMKDLFGTNYMSEGQYLLDAIKSGAFSDLGDQLQYASEGVDEFGNSWDALDNMYETATDNLTGRMDILKSSASDLGISIYQSMAGGLYQMAEDGTEYIRQLSQAFEEDGVSGMAGKAGMIIGQIAADLETYGPELITAGIGAAESFLSGIDDSSGQIGACVSTLVTTFLTEFPGYTATFVTTGGDILKSILSGFAQEDSAGQIVEAVTTAFSSIGTYIQENGGAFGEAAGTIISQLAQGLADNAGDILVGGIHLITGIVEGIFTALPILIESSPAIVKGVIEGLANAGPELLEAGKNLVLTIVDGMKDTGDAIADAVYEAIDALGGINEYGTDYGEMYGETYVDGLTDYISNNKEDVLQATQQLLGQQVSDEQFRSYGDAVESYISMFANGQIDTSWLEALGSTESAQALEIINSAMQEIASQSTEMQETANAIEQIAETAEETGASMEETTQSANRFEEQLQGMESGTQTIAEMGAAAQESLDNLAQSEQEASNNAQNVIDTMSSMTSVSELISAATSGQDVGAISTEISSVFSSIQSSADSTMPAVSATVSSAMTTVSTSFSTAASSASTAMSTMVSAVSSGGSSAVSSARSAASGIAGAFSGIDLYSTGYYIMQGLTNGINSSGAAAVAAAAAIAERIKSTLAGVLDVHSPSRYTEWLAKMMGVGFVNESERQEKYVSNAAAGMVSGVGEGMETTLSHGLSDINSSEISSTSNYGGNATVTFSPTITITGNASEKDVRSALSWSMDEFRTMYQKMINTDKRRSFA